MQQKLNVQPIQVLLAEDHDIVRCGVKGIFEQEPNLNLIAESSSFNNTLSLAKAVTPDVILLDLTLDDGNSLNRIPELIQACPQCKVLLFTVLHDKETLLLAMRYGASGVFEKSQSSELLCKAIRHVYAGDLWIDRALTAQLWQHDLKHNSELPHASVLTIKECNIACLSAKGLAAKYIGKQLSISEKTVRNYLTSVYSKLGVKNQVELSLHAESLGFCRLDDKSRNRDICPYHFRTDGSCYENKNM